MVTVWTEKFGFILHLNKGPLSVTSCGAECMKPPTQLFGVTLRGVSGLCVLAAVLPCYNDRNGRRPFKYQINIKLNFLAVQATLSITCN